MPDHVQEQWVQDAPSPVATVVPTVILLANAVARLLNVLEALVPLQGGSSAPQATLQTQAPAQTQTFGNKEVSLQEFLKFKSPKFTSSDNSVDPQSFLDGTLKALRALGCSSERVVELAEYKLDDMANTWYETVLLGRPAGVAPLTWDEFICQTYGISYLGQCHVLTGECFRCGQLGHHLRDCPQPPANFNQASIQSVVPTQTTRNTSGAASTGNRGRGAGDYATVNQGQGNAGRGQARVFAFTRQDAQPSNAMVTGILSVCTFDALALIDPGSTHSYVSSYFALRFGRQPELLNDPFLVATPVRESLLAEYVYRAYQIRVEGRDTLADLIVLHMIDFDMLIGIDWLSSCYAIIDCHAKIVKFAILNEPSFVLKEGQVPDICKVVSFMKAQRLLKKGYLGLLAIVNDTREETISIENVPLVREFSNVFPKDLPGLPLV
ncbi:uncharacterized protein [Nicotiana tomentosiformis]|uniref:uncharacterized protein n=1 Tax=Nicotiana tomentosiformis TaxID=4098 RepID=UPI00388CCFB3